MPFLIGVFWGVLAAFFVLSITVSCDRRASIMGAGLAAVSGLVAGTLVGLVVQAGGGL